MTEQQPPDQQPPPSAAPTPAAGSPAFLDGLLWLLGFWLGGEVVVRAIDVPVPGAVVGMLALFAMLQWRARRARAQPANLIRAADGLLAHLQLLFVPAGVGIVAVLGVLRDDALPVIGALVVSWAVGLVVVGWAVTLLLPRTDRVRDAGGAS